MSPALVCHVLHTLPTVCHIRWIKKHKDRKCTCVRSHGKWQLRAAGELCHAVKDIVQKGLTVTQATYR